MDSPQFELQQDPKYFSNYRMLGLGGIFIKCVQEDYNLYFKLGPSVRIAKFYKGLSTGQGDPFGCFRVKEMALYLF